MICPAPAMPSVRLAATEPTPAMAITPSAMQAMKTAEAAQAAAQFAPGEAQRGEPAGSRYRGVHQRAFGMKRASRKCTGA